MLGETFDRVIVLEELARAVAAAGQARHRVGATAPADRQAG